MAPTQTRASATPSTCGRRRPIQVRIHRSRRSVSRNIARELCQAFLASTSSNSARQICRSSGRARRRSWATISTSRRKPRSCATDRPGASTLQRPRVLCSTGSGLTTVTSARPATESGRITRRRIPRTSLVRRKAASILAKPFRRACLDRPGCGTRTSTPRGSREASSSALWAIRARLARLCSAAFRSSRKTTARLYGTIG